MAWAPGSLASAALAIPPVAVGAQRSAAGVTPGSRREPAPLAGRSKGDAILALLFPDRKEEGRPEGGARLAVGDRGQMHPRARATLGQGELKSQGAVRDQVLRLAALAVVLRPER